MAAATTIVTAGLQVGSAVKSFSQSKKQQTAAECVLVTHNHILIPMKWYIITNITNITHGMVYFFTIGSHIQYIITVLHART